MCVRRKTEDLPDFMLTRDEQLEKESRRAERSAAQVAGVDEDEPEAQPSPPPVKRPVVTGVRLEPVSEYDPFLLKQGANSGLVPDWQRKLKRMRADPDNQLQHRRKPLF